MPSSTAATLFRSVGLLADGPVRWGRPIPAQGPGVFVLEFPTPLPTAPIELTRVGKWIERVESLRLDGERPTSRALAARLASFWLPSQTVVFIGATEASISRRVASMAATSLGDRRPSSSGHWLKTLRSLDDVLVWWSPTAATEEYEDALLTAFADGVPDAERAASGDPHVVLPFANLRRPTGERRTSGLSGSLIAEPVAPPPPPTRVVLVPDGDAEGARGEPPTPRRRGGITDGASGAGGAGGTGGPGGGAGTAATTRGGASESGSASGSAEGAPGGAPVAPAASAVRSSSAPRAASAPRPASPAPRGSGSRSSASRRPSNAPVTITAEGAERMRAELDELTTVRRPQVIARIRAAKELGDLKENADYTAAREEQSFLEGRIQALEARLRDAVIAAERAAGAHADIGSVVTVEADGLTTTYTLVGSSESDPKSGRVSVVSPVGRALVGAMAGDEVVVETPRGHTTYRVSAIE